MLEKLTECLQCSRFDEVAKTDAATEEVREPALAKWKDLKRPTMVDEHVQLEKEMKQVTGIIIKIEQSMLCELVKGKTDSVKLNKKYFFLPNTRSTKSCGWRAKSIIERKGIICGDSTKRGDTLGI